MKTIIKVAVRVITLLMSAYLLDFLVSNIRSAINNQNVNPDQNLVFILTLILVACLIPYLLLIILWIKSDWLAAVLTGKTNENFPISAAELFRISLVFLSVYLFIQSIPSLLEVTAYRVNAFGLFKGASVSNASISVNELSNLVSENLSLLICVSLALGTKELTKLFASIGRFVDPKRNLTNLKTMATYFKKRLA